MIPTLLQQELALSISKRHVTTFWVAAHVGAAVVATTCAVLLGNTSWPFLVLFTFLLVAIAQELVLHRYLVGVQTGRWALPMIVGGLLAIVPSLLIPVNITFTLSTPMDDIASVTGAVRPFDPADVQIAIIFICAVTIVAVAVGIAQSKSLAPYLAREYSDKAYERRWIAVTVVAWIIGGGIAAFLSLLNLEGRPVIHGPSAESAGHVAAHAVYLMVAVGVSGLITGRYIDKLLVTGKLITTPLVEAVPSEQNLEVRIIVTSTLSLILGLLLLWFTYGLATYSFDWPNGYYGPGVTVNGPAPYEYYATARWITGSMLASSVGYVLVILAVTLRALTNWPRTAADSWGRYWIVTLSALVFVCLFNLWGFGAWLMQYTD